MRARRASRSPAACPSLARRGARPARWAAALLALAGCDSLQGFGGEVPPLATFQVSLSGDPEALRPAEDTGALKLHVALVWGKQWLVEPLCILPPESPAAAAVLAAGCPDPFRFVPVRVEARAPITVGEVATLPLDTLPSADVLVGILTSRVAYASLVVYDDRDRSGTLELARPNRLGNPDNGPNNDPTPTVTRDRVYASSFLTMTAPDQRVAYREGVFNAGAAFYPRAGCPAPPPAFSIVGAGGFSLADAVRATIAGQLPPEDPASCTSASPDQAVVALAARAPAEVQQAACTERVVDSSVRYREPPGEAPDFTRRTTGCVHLPSFGAPSPIVQLVVSGRSDDSCKGLTHYVLRGCRADPECAIPDWDFTATPPSWWPCPP